MKILVYTLAINSRAKVDEILKAKEIELKAKYPGFALMVITGNVDDGDKVHMIDMTPSPYPPNYTLGNPILAGYPYPITTGTTATAIQPFTTTTGGGYTIGSSGTFGMAEAGIKFSTHVSDIYINPHDAAVKAETTDWIATGHGGETYSSDGPECPRCGFTSQIVTGSGGTSSYTTGENVVKFPPK